MRIQYQTLTAVALSATGLASAVAITGGAGGSYTLSSTTPNDSCGHILTFKNKSATDYSAATIAFTGLDADGASISEAVTGPAGSATVSSTKFFASGIAVSSNTDTGVSTFDIGWTAGAVGPTLQIANERVAVPNAEVFCRVPSGSPTYALQYTADATPAGIDSVTSWLAHSTITGKSATFDGQIGFCVLGVRLHFTAAGTVNMTLIEPFPA